MSENTYIVVGSKPWNGLLFDTHLKHLLGVWHYVTTQETLELLLKDENPRYIFFLHWSKMVPEWITEKYECICFHPTKLPFGRGGTPIQNLIEHGHTHTSLTAFRMTQELDAGPIYYQKDGIPLIGNALGIFNRLMDEAYDIIKYIIKKEPEPIPQEGITIYFTRRTPQQSEIEDLMELDYLYHHIRMLDAPTYPRAFLETSNLRFEFYNAELRDGKIRASVEITENGKRVDD